MNDGAVDPFGLIGSTLSDKYEVERLIGEGGFGVVYAGKHRSLGEQVAIKCLKPVAGLTAGEAQATQQFLREARVLFSLTHPAIVRLYDAGEVATRVGGVPYVVLELVAGVPLDQEIARRARERRPFSAQELLGVFEPILSAIAFAHQHGVCHRDLKPSNVMLVPTAAGGVTAKVLDFGTARAGGQDVSMGTTGFTPRYASPEQWDKTYGTTGPASDIFSLGLILAETCTLEPAFGGDSPGQILAQVLNPSFAVSVRARRPDLPEGFEHVVRRATERQAHARFASAQEMLDALRAATNGASASASSSFGGAPSAYGPGPTLASPGAGPGGGPGASPGAWTGPSPTGSMPIASMPMPMTPAPPQLAYGVGATGPRPTASSGGGSGALIAFAVVGGVVLLGGLGAGFLLLGRGKAASSSTSGGAAVAAVGDPTGEPQSTGASTATTATPTPTAPGTTGGAGPAGSGAHPVGAGSGTHHPGAGGSATAGAGTPTPTSTTTPTSTSTSTSTAGGPKRSMTVALHAAAAHVKEGEKVAVSFSAPLDPAGERYWITLVPTSFADDRWSDEWHYLDPGTTRTVLTAPSAPGPMEVRLHDRYSELTTHVIARTKVTVDGP